MSYPYPQQDPWADPTAAHPPPPEQLPPTTPFPSAAEHHPPAPTSPAQPHPPAQHYPLEQHYPPAQHYLPARQYPPAPHYPPAPQYAPTSHPQQFYAVPVVPTKSTGTAVVLELVPGLFGVFGIGNMYAGRIGTGIALMVSYWVLFWINVVLAFFLIGVATLALTWIVFMVVGPLLAVSAVGRHNSGTPVR
jgi:TM2 domain-containing membrane protein YozV